MKIACECGVDASVLLFLCLQLQCSFSCYKLTNKLAKYLTN